MMKKWYVKTSKALFNEYMCQDTSDLEEETQEEQNNERERSHTQAGWSMYQSAYNIMSVDDTKSVSGYDGYDSDSDDDDSDDSLPESIIKIFTDEENSRKIDADDMSSDGDDLPTIFPNHTYDSSDDENDTENLLC